MYAQYPPQESVLRNSAAETVDGDLRVRTPGFQSSASPLLGATPRAHKLFKKNQGNDMHNQGNNKIIFFKGYNLQEWTEERIVCEDRNYK